MKWNVMLSPYYLDNATDRARELDLVCEKEYAFNTRFGKPKNIRIQLFVECKYVKSPVVFWFDKVDEQAARRWLDKHTPFKSEHSLTDHHRYLNSGGDAAKLFARSKQPVQEENDPTYKALAQCLGGLIHYRYLPPLFVSKFEGASATFLKYPVIVHSPNADFYSTRVESSDTVPDKLTNNFLLEVNYAYRRMTGADELEYFLIDVVGYDRLDKFLAIIDRESLSAMKALDD
jgi:hypothetical protein